MRPGTEGPLAAPRHLLVRALVRHSGLLRVAPFLTLPTRFANSVCLALLVSSPFMSPLLAWSSSRWIWLRYSTYSGLVTFPARQRVLASLTSLLVSAFCCCVWRSLVMAIEASNRKNFLGDSRDSGCCCGQRLRSLLCFSVLCCFQVSGSVFSNTASSGARRLVQLFPLRSADQGAADTPWAGTQFCCSRRGSASWAPGPCKHTVHQEGTAENLGSLTSGWRGLRISPLFFHASWSCTTFHRPLGLVL